MRVSWAKTQWKKKKRRRRCLYRLELGPWNWTEWWRRRCICSTLFLILLTIRIDYPLPASHRISLHSFFHHFLLGWGAAFSSAKRQEGDRLDSLHNSLAETQQNLLHLSN